MKLLVYGVDISISINGYKDWNCDQDAPLICGLN